MINAVTCPHCTAPLDPSLGSVTLCPFCSHVITGVAAFPWDPGPRPPYAGRPEDAGKTRVRVGDQTFVVEGRIGSGDSSEVFLGHRDRPLMENVVLKLLAAEEDADLLSREVTMVRRLARSEADGASYFTRLLPSVVRHGPSSIDGGDGPLATVFRWRSGFTVSLEDARAAFPGGVDPRAAVWIWKRSLELLTWVHTSGFVHGAVLPSHLLLHPQDHGVVFVGWGATTWRHGRGREALPSRCLAMQAHYPEDVWAGAAPEPSTDLAMSARAIAWLLGGDPSNGRTGRAVPRPLATLIERTADPRRAGDDAWALRKALGRAAEEAFGPPAFVPFDVPARRRRK